MKKRQTNAFLRVLSHGPLMWMLACTNVTPEGPFAQFCPSDTTPGSGNLDRPSGVTLALPTSSGGAYAVVVNPDIRQARAVDLSEGLLVPAPNIYFPMAVKLGTYTERIAASSDGNVAVALDPADENVRFFRIGPISNADSWRKIGEPAGVAGFPTGLAVSGPESDLTVVVSHAAEPGSVTILKWSAASGTMQTRRVELGGRPSGVAIADDGTIVVSNAGGSSVWLLALNTPDGTAAPFPPCTAGDRPCSLDVGGRTNNVTAGGAKNASERFERYPAALLMHIDRPAVTVVRIADGSIDEDHVMGTVTMPRQPVAAALAPDGAPLCCVGGPFTDAPQALAQGGFAYAVVALLDGSIAYLDFSARAADGTRTPRLIDKNPEPPGLPVDVNTELSVYQEPGMDPGVSPDNRRPVAVVDLAGRDYAGSPPVVNQNIDADYLLTWEGVLAGLGGRRASATDSQLLSGVVQDVDAGIDLVRQGVQPGDTLEIPKQQGCGCPASDEECTIVARLTITEVAGATMRLDGTFSVRECVRQDGGFVYTVRARDAWVLEGLGNAVYARVRYFDTVEVPGARLTLLPAGYSASAPEPVETRDGAIIVNPPAYATDVRPPPMDTRLVVPIRSNYNPFVLDPDDVSPEQGRYLPANAIPTGIVAAMIPAVFTTASGDTTTGIKAVGVMSTAGGGLIMQFDLGVHPACVAGEPGCPARLTRGSSDTSVRFYE